MSGFELWLALGLISTLGYILWHRIILAGARYAKAHPMTREDVDRADEPGYVPSYKKGRWWHRASRKAKIGGIAGGMIFLGMAVALALLITSQNASDSFQAADVGNINIGNAATEGLFASSLDSALLSFEPGDNIAASCVNVKVTNQQSGDNAKFYVGSITGALAPFLTISIEQQAFVGPAGQATCLSSGTWTPIFGPGLLTAFKAALPDFGSGVALLDDNGTQFRIFLSMDPGVDGGAIAGNSAALTVVFENQN